MFFVTFLTITAAVVLASPVERQAKVAVLSLKYVSNVTSMKNVVYRGLARINKINGATLNVSSDLFTNDDFNSGLVTNDDMFYIAPVSIGGNTRQLKVDTGSSNTWCGAESSCEPTSTGKSTGGSVTVNYSNSNHSWFKGEEYTDDVSFGGLIVSSQSIGAASESWGFDGVDGVIGFGPVNLTNGTVSNANTVPTFLDNLYRQGSISTEVLGISFRPESGSDIDDTNGELTFGGTDSSKYSGLLTYFPKLTSGDASPYWGISISSFTYGSTTLASSGTGIIDTGTTLIYIPTSAYNNFLSAANGITDPNSGLASFTTQPESNFSIEFGSTTYTLTPSQYLIPTAQSIYWGLNPGIYYAWINDGGSSGINTMIGQKFLENYYTVLDTTQSRIGFATGV